MSKVLTSFTLFFTCLTKSDRPAFFLLWSKLSTVSSIVASRFSSGFESIEHSTNEPHTVPFIVEGKCGSVRIKLISAPRGTGLVVGDQVKKILRLAGIHDVYGVTTGQTRTTFNVAKACMDALIKTNQMEL